LPRTIKDDLWCYNNQLTSFVGCAQTIDGNLYGYNNELLTSFEGAPGFVGKNVYLANCPKLTSLQNIHLYFPEVHGLFNFTDTGVKEHMLGVLLVRGLQGIALSDKKLGAILCNHLKSKNLLACALELIEAGYEEQAKL
jgi:hypothetical protein